MLKSFIKKLSHKDKREKDSYLIFTWSKCGQNNQTKPPTGSSSIY